MSEAIQIIETRLEELRKSPLIQDFWRTRQITKAYEQGIITEIAALHSLKEKLKARSA